MERSISDKERRNLYSNTAKLANIGFGSDISSTNKYQLNKVEFVAGTSDMNSYLKFTIKKFVAGNPRRFGYCTGPMVDLEDGAVIFSDVEEVENWDSWSAYTGETECSEGDLVKTTDSGLTYVCNIGGVIKAISYESEYAGSKLYGENIQALATTTSGQIEIKPKSDDSFTYIYRKVTLNTVA